MSASAPVSAAPHRIVANVVLDGRAGGPHWRIIQVGEVLRAHGWETILVFPAMGDDLPRLLEDRGFPYVTVRLSRLRRRLFLFSAILGLLRLPLEILRLMALFKRHDVAVVHANGLFGAQAVLAARLAGRPSVWHLNDMSISTRLSVLLRALLGNLVSARAYSAVRVRTHHGDRETAETAILYPPVDLDRFKPEIATQRVCFDIPALERQRDETILLAVGNINPLKGYSYLIEALGQLRDLDASWRMVIIGAPLSTNRPYYQRLRARVAALGIENRVVFAGPSDRVPEAMTACDVFVMSSIAESGPMVVLEALACGKPVVVTDVGLVDEAVRDGRNGLVVPPKDSARLAAALRRLITDRALRDMLAGQARAGIGERYSVRAAARAHNELYRRIVHESAA